VYGVRDFASYLYRLVGDAIFRGAAIAGALAFLVKSLLPSPRRAAILDSPSLYLVILGIGFVVAAYRLDRSLRARVSTERAALVRELRTMLISLKFNIERRNKEPVPINQAMVIEGLARDLRDEYVIAECGEIKTILQRNYDSRYHVAYMFEDARVDYDSVRGRVDHVLKHLDEVYGPGKPKS